MPAARFIFFAFVFSFIFAYIGKWVFLYFSKLWNKDKNKFIDLSDKEQFESLKCKSLNTHNMSGKNWNSKCSWCGKTLKEIKEENKKQKLIYG